MLFKQMLFEQLTRPCLSDTFSSLSIYVVLPPFCWKQKKSNSDKKKLVLSIIVYLPFDKWQELHLSMQMT